MRKKCKASDCSILVKPRSTPGRPKEYCCSRCKDREKMRIYRKRRVKNGKCPQCGEEMDYPKSFHKNKENPKHCSKCQKYYSERYESKKEA